MMTFPHIELPLRSNPCFWFAPFFAATLALCWFEAKPSTTLPTQLGQSAGGYVFRLLDCNRRLCRRLLGCPGFRECSYPQSSCGL
jgi:hypothetical protein